MWQMSIKNYHLTTAFVALKKFFFLLFSKFEESHVHTLSNQSIWLLHKIFARQPRVLPLLLILIYTSLYLKWKTPCERPTGKTLFHIYSNRNINLTLDYYNRTWFNKFFFQITYFSQHTITNNHKNLFTETKNLVCEWNVVVDMFTIKHWNCIPINENWNCFQSRFSFLKLRTDTDFICRSKSWYQVSEGGNKIFMVSRLVSSSLSRFLSISLFLSFSACAFRESCSDSRMT